jgi:hypothetical protein
MIEKMYCQGKQHAMRRKQEVAMAYLHYKLLDDWRPNITKIATELKVSIKFVKKIESELQTYGHVLFNEEILLRNLCAHGGVQNGGTSAIPMTDFDHAMSNASTNAWRGKTDDVIMPPLLATAPHPFSSPPAPPPPPPSQIDNQLLIYHWPTTGGEGGVNNNAHHTTQLGGGSTTGAGGTVFIIVQAPCRLQ